MGVDFRNVSKKSRSSFATCTLDTEIATRRHTGRLGSKAAHQGTRCALRFRRASRLGGFSAKNCRHRKVLFGP
jgi:hypothetical protein